MKLAALADGLSHATIAGDPAVEVVALAYHTQQVIPGTLFFCVPGTRADGHAFAPAAVAAGAVALVCERPLDDVPGTVTQVLVPSVREAMALMASRFYGDPTRDLLVAAVTGTNGKTTTAHLLCGVLESAGRRPALLGTVVNRVAGVDSPAKLTTPDSLDLQRLFREMVDGGDDACVMEASSHAMVMRRTTGIDFDAVLFTNLTRDHLDFHKDVDDYFLAKRMLFLTAAAERRPAAVAVVNVDDEYGRRLADECRGPYGDDLWTYSVRDAGGDLTDDQAVGFADADVTATAIELGVDWSRFTLVCPRRGLRERLELPLPARFNVANATAAAAAALALGLPSDVIVAGLRASHGVPGRVEPVRAGQPFAVLVDYAHTPDSLENVLRAARGIAAGRVICVFGCGGDRDRGKRPLMGAAVATLADLAIVTSDNPRSEDPQAIIAAIVAGIAADAVAGVVVEPDRAAAIATAVGRAGPGDVVVLAGKGHETYQILGPTTIHFDDREVAREALSRLGWKGDEAGSAGAAVAPRPGTGETAPGGAKES